MLGTLFNRNRVQKREILHNSRTILDYLSNNLGERSIRKYDNLESAARYIRDWFTRYGHPPDEEDYMAAGKKVQNLITDIPGRDPRAGMILLGAHYDTIEGTAGADDNASGITGLLEVYRLLSARQFKRTIRFIAFTLEEPPFFSGDHMGSMVCAKNARARKDNIELMVCLEMIGCGGKKYEQHIPFRDMARKTPRVGDFLAVVSLPSSSEYTFLFKKVYNRHSRKEIIDFIGPSSIPGISHSDHYSFVKQGYPAIMLTDTAFYRNANYHTEHDTFDTINLKFITDNIWNIHLALAEIADLESLKPSPIEGASG
jgi:Zn-dependent M28 family amino/carboxypeptidase